MKTLFSFIVAIFFFVVSAPYLGETEMGKRFICRVLFERYGWKGSFETLRFHWNFHQEFSGLVLSNGEVEVTIEEGKIHRSLFELLKDPFSPIPISLESGILRSEKNSLLHEILSLLHLTLDIDAHTAAQFHKVTLSFYKGMYTYPRTDFWVAGKYPFVTWGSIDVKNRKLEIELGPTSKFFESMFKIRNLPPDFVLPFKIEGSFEKTHVSAEKAFETLAKVILRQKILGLGKHPE